MRQCAAQQGGFKTGVISVERNERKHEAFCFDLHMNGLLDELLFLNTDFSCTARPALRINLLNESCCGVG